jgi:hypothetical protein
VHGGDGATAKNMIQRRISLMPSDAITNHETASPASEAPWTFDADSNDIELHGCPIFKLYRQEDFPCIEDDERAAADMDYLAHAQVVVMVLNAIANATEPTLGEMLRNLAMQSASPTPRETLVIHSRGPNTPAMVLCAKLADGGTFVSIAKMEKALKALKDTQQSTRETVNDLGLTPAAQKQMDALCEQHDTRESDREAKHGH